MSPAGSIALLVLGIIAIVGIIYWALEAQVAKFVEALIAHRRKLAEAEHEQEQADANSAAATTA
jgi:hypothetical protein